jgi:hypothetical protein
MVSSSELAKAMLMETREQEVKGLSLLIVRKLQLKSGSDYELDRYEIAFSDAATTWFGNNVGLGVASEMFGIAHYGRLERDDHPLKL